MLCTTCAAASSSFAASAAQELQVNATTNATNSNTFVIYPPHCCSNYPTVHGIRSLPTLSLHRINPQVFRQMATPMNTDRCGHSADSPNVFRRVVHKRHASIQQESR